MKEKLFVKKSGFSYLELVFCLFILLNLFVLCQQIFYNINIHSKIIKNNNTLTYETLVLRIENHLKEATLYEIGSNYLKYDYRQQHYQYYVYNNAIVMKINNSSYAIIDGIKEINFILNNYYIEITIINQMNQIYYTQVIFYVS